MARARKNPMRRSESMPDPAPPEAGSASPFLSDAEIERLAEATETAFGRLIEYTASRGTDLRDGLRNTLRLQPLARRLRAEREARGWSLKDAAGALRCPQYRLRDIEAANTTGLTGTLLRRYAEALGIDAFLRAWIEAAPQLAAKLGLTATPAATYRLRITLLGVEPAVWRRIDIPSVYSFWDLHVAIQDAMGWNDSHLHVFSRPHTELGPGEVIGIPDPDGEIVTRAGWETPCTYWLRRAGDTLQYEYDFGDGWLHEIVLEAILDPEPRQNLPRCIEGARACPPEDCGGPHGYAELLAILRDPGHPEHASMCEWLGRRFDPEKFSAKTVHFDDARKRLRLALGLRG